MAKVRCYLVPVGGLCCPVSAYDFDNYVDDVIEYVQGNDNLELVVRDDLVSSTLFQDYYLNGVKFGTINYSLDETEISDYKKMGFIPELFACYDSNTNNLVSMGVL